MVPGYERDVVTMKTEEEPKARKKRRGAFVKDHLFDGLTEMGKKKGQRKKDSGSSLLY